MVWMSLGKYHEEVLMDFPMFSSMKQIISLEFYLLTESVTQNLYDVR